MKCLIESCSASANHKGLCGKHYKRQWRHGDPNKTLIHMHEGERCCVIACARPAAKKHLCKMHYNRLWRYGRTDNIRAPGGQGRPLTTAGYVLLTINDQRKYEHIHIAEMALGKRLPPKVIVHHVNGVPWDNFTPFNLVICPDQAYHMLLHQRTKAIGL